MNTHTAITHTVYACILIVQTFNEHQYISTLQTATLSLQIFSGIGCSLKTDREETKIVYIISDS